MFLLHRAKDLRHIRGRQSRASSERFECRTEYACGDASKIPIGQLTVRRGWKIKTSQVRIATMATR